MASVEERFWPKVEKAEDGCWNWTAAKNWGYGAFWNGERVLGAHRVSYEMFVGPIPEGLTLDHLCRNPGCVNPEHLEPVTMRENVMRGNGASAVNAARTECVNGHSFTDANTYVDAKGWRKCRRCRSDRMRRYHLARKASS